MNGLALCAGAGGLELGISLAEPDYRTVCYVDGEAYAAVVLVARMADEALDEAPIWSDLRTFDGTAWRGKVACITAGFPCQPVSVAGARKAQDDDRWLWPDVARVVREVGPSRVFLENVPGLLSAGLGDVLGDLAAMGFDAEWGVFRAADVGASHRRARVFILADATGEREREPHDETRAEPRQDTRQGTGGRGYGMADALGTGLEVGRGQPSNTQPERSAAERNGIAIFPPGPNGDWPAWLAAHPDTEPAVRRGSDGLADRVDRLRACGNGVVPLAAAYAYRSLKARLI